MKCPKCQKEMTNNKPAADAEKQIDNTICEVYDCVPCHGRMFFVVKS
jgi:hypothetical protein